MTIDDELGKLDRSVPVPALDHLEADIWAGVSARQKAMRMSRIVMASQAAAVALVLMSGIAVKNRLEDTALASGSGLWASTNGMTLAPSTLLLGRHS